MPKLNRRSFLKLMGQGSAVLSIGSLGFSGKTFAAGTKARKVADNEWEFYYPVVYDGSFSAVFGLRSALSV